MRQKLLDKGYHEYDPTRFDSPYVKRRYQKRFDDDKGKKYFIDALEWEPLREDINPGWEFELQLYQKDTHLPINVTCFAGWDVDDVEKFIEDLWTPEKFDYYEEWE